MSIDLKKLENKLDEALSNETNETLTKFLTDKRMSNNKQSSVDFLFQNMFELSQTLVTSGETQYELMMQVYQQAKAMHNEEIESTYDDAIMKGRHEDGVEYYKEKFGGNK